MEDLFPTDNPKSYVAGEADRSNRYRATHLAIDTIKSVS
jgi:hypothetical protein